MTENDVVNSQAFRAINLLIDQKSSELKGYMTGFHSRVDDMFTKPEYPACVYVRTYEEHKQLGCDREFETPIHAHQVKDLRFYIDTIERLDREIGELFRFKCALLGDWDYTKGNLSEMKTVFGNLIEGMAEEEE